MLIRFDLWKLITSLQYYFMLDKRILNIYAIITGLLFIISGAGKVTDTTAFSNLIYQYGLGYLMILSPVIVVAEIFIGISLILLIKPKLFSLLAFMLLFIFSFAFAYGHFVHGINDCGCFGTLIRTNISPIYIFLRNLILMVMSLFVFLKYPVQKDPIVSWKKYLVQIIMYTAIFIAGLSFTTPDFLKPTTGKHRFQDENVTNTALSNYIKTSADSTYLVFCFSYTCPHCWNSIENLRQFIKDKTVDRVIAFGTGETNERNAFIKNFKPDFSITELPLKNISTLTEIFPTAFFIEQDTIKTVIQSVLPSPVTFKNNQLAAN